MTLALVSDLSRNLLVRTFAATAVVFLVTALATGVLPLGCFTGATSCVAHAPVQVTPVIDNPAAPPSAEVPVAQKVAAISPISPTLTQNEVVAGSFAALTVGATTPAASGDVPNADDDMTAPKVRSVKTVAIRTDGTPDLGASTVTPQTATPLAAPASAPETQLAMATPQVAPLVAPATNSNGDALGYTSTASKAPVPETAATRAADDIASGTAPSDVVPVAKVASVAPARKTTVAKPSASDEGHSGTLKGAGANVHADAKNASRILFALPGGTKVTVLEQAHGWVHITDAKGRSGWIYKDYISA